MAAKLNKALDEERAGEACRRVREGSEPMLKNKRRCLLKRPENLTDKQNVSLRELLAYNSKSVRAYLLTEEFQLFWEHDSPAWAAKVLDAWCRRAMRSRIDPVKMVARTVRAHRELLLNYFRAKKQFYSGVIEGLSIKAKVTPKRAHGYRTFRIAELSLYHLLGKLPEPKLAHRFF
jgi:transposase